jgi:autotransporter-associated beta strand protein
VISNNCVVDFNNYAGNDNVNGAWSGGGTVTISNLASFASTFTIGGGSSSATMNNFSGKIIIAPFSGLANGPAEGTLRFNSGGSSYNVGSTSMSVDLGPAPSAVSLITRNSTAGNPGTVTSLGELKGGADCSLIGSRSSNGIDTWSIGGLNTSTTFYGAMTNSTGGQTNLSAYASGILAITKVGSGTLTLAGTNYYTGNTTFSGGFLNAGSPEATAAYANPIFAWGQIGGAPNWYGGPFGMPTNWGVGNPSNLTQSYFAFNGGTLQYSAVNHYDYSGRFATNGSQKISIDVNGQNVTFATPIFGASTSLTNMDTAGGGSLTLTAQEYYTGPTVVASGGNLKLSGGGALTSGTTLP